MKSDDNHNLDKMDEIKDELQLLKTSIEMESQIAKVFESINDIANKTHIHETKITTIEKDIIILTKGQEQLAKVQEQLKNSTDRLHKKMDELDKSQSILGVVVNNTHDKVVTFIERHEKDAPRAIKTMKNLIWSAIVVALALFGSIAGFMAYQNNIIIQGEQEKTKLIKEMYECKKEQGPIKGN